jgi:phage repressor protein C with HTH and peptisase S24 domain
MAKQKTNEGAVLATWLTNNNTSVQALADDLGVKRGTVYYHLKSESIADEFKNRLIQKGYHIPEIGVKPLTKKQATKDEATRVDLYDQNIMWVPLVASYAHAGYMSGYADPEFLDSLPKEPFPADREYKGTYMCFEVKGDSMDDDSKRAICQGDKLLCRELGRQHWKNKLHIHKYDFVIGMKTDGLVVKQIVAHDVANGIITLHSLNPLYEDYDVKLEDVAVLFNVVEIKRKR